MFETLTDEQLTITREQLLKYPDAESVHLAEKVELELIRRKMSPIEEIFPDGGYVAELETGEEIFVPFVKSGTAG